MNLPTDAPPPDWVTDSASQINGLDLLALRAPAMRIGNRLLDGITTVTPSIRYLGIISWIIKEYWERRGLDNRKEFLSFARSVESAIVLGNLLVDPATVGLVGAIGARNLLGDALEISLESKVKAIAMSIYSGPAEQLGLISFERNTAIPHLTMSKGIPVAEEVARVAKATTLCARLIGGNVPGAVAREELLEFGRALHLRSLGESEKRALVRSLIPTEPETLGAQLRAASYSALLGLAEARGTLEEGELLEAASARHRGVSPVHEEILDGWALDHVRDLLAVAHEYTFDVAMGELERSAQSRNVSARRDDVVASALADESALDGVLRDLGLLYDSEHWSDLTVRDLATRVEAATALDETVERGLRRWEGGLQEHDLIRVARSAGAGAPVVTVVAWILVARRVGRGVEERRTEFEVLSRQPFARLGVREIVLPWCERCTREATPLAQATAELVALSVDQHLRTAWSRLAVDAKRDVAVLVVDGEDWAFRKRSRPGRTNSRLGQAIGWLEQLGLLVGGGITPFGSEVLDQARTCWDARSPHEPS